VEEAAVGDGAVSVGVDRPVVVAAVGARSTVRFGVFVSAAAPRGHRRLLAHRRCVVSCVQWCPPSSLALTTSIHLRTSARRGEGHPWVSTSRRYC
jgi:hypothetical protein